VKLVDPVHVADEFDDELVVRNLRAGAGVGDGFRQRGLGDGRPVRVVILLGVVIDDLYIHAAVDRALERAQECRAEVPRRRGSRLTHRAVPSAQRTTVPGGGTARYQRMANGGTIVTIFGGSGFLGRYIRSDTQVERPGD
jgi:hypothetical protein